MADRPIREPKPFLVLTECCAHSVQCRLHLLHGYQVIAGQFHAVTPHHVAVRVECGMRTDMFQPAALCCVAFPFQQSFYGFLACVRQVQDAAAGLEVQLDFPATLESTNLRSSFRVPVTAASHVELTIHLADGTQIAGEPVNVSETGIEVKLPIDDSRLDINSPVDFELRFGGERLELPAVVRRRQQTHRGLQFTGLNTPDSRHRAAALQRLVRSLERIWLKNRLA